MRARLPWARRIALAALLSLPLAFAGAATLVLRADEWCPHTCGAGDAQPGYLVEIARAIFERDGTEVRYEVVNWSRLRTYAEQPSPSNQAWAVLGVGRSAQTQALYVFPQEESGRSPFCFFTRADSRWQFQDVQGLAGQRLGVVNGYAYSPAIDAYLQSKAKSAEVEIAAGPTALRTNVRKLLLGRLDLLLDDRAAVRFELRRAGNEDKALREAGCLRDEDTRLFIAFPRNQPGAKEMAEVLSAGMKRLRASGELARILARYGERDWRPTR